MEGVNYIVDGKGRKRAVVVDLELHGELWEDVYDAMIAEERKAEDRLSWDSIRQGKVGRKSKKK